MFYSSSSSNNFATKRHWIASNSACVGVLKYIVHNTAWSRLSVDFAAALQVRLEPQSFQNDNAALHANPSNRFFIV